MENKKSFVLYCDLITSISHLTNEEKGILFQHLLEYVNDMNPVLEDRLLLTAWKPIELQLKRDLIKFKEKKEKLSENGKKGAEKRWGGQTNYSHPITENGVAKNTMAKMPVSGTGSVNVNVNVSGSGSGHTKPPTQNYPTIYQEIITKYGATDFEADGAYETFLQLSDKEKELAVGSIEKYFLFLENKPNYTKKELFYFFKDKVWEWNSVKGIKPKPKTKKQLDDEFLERIKQQMEEQLKTK